MELVSFADIKAFLGLADSLVTDYPALNIIQPSVVAAIESYLGRDLESKARSETLPITGPTDIIKLRALPIASVASLVITMNNDSQTYDSDDYIIAEYGLLLSSKLRNASVAITYTGGLSSVPEAIERAALYQTVFEFQAKDQAGADSVSMEGGSVNRPSFGLLDHVRQLLTPFIHPLKIWA